ncbi:hypothetical protein [Tunicatimonas pelagia]|uniref:hypothetical protein n=1 Tax=Tunicatimonas pelagia TaxID=931531 RepID=UPI0026664F4C|nr:hypothetical protein [Tunicatimonas pelagia]WKN43420.1 hypothetical protein P0M28_00350 [Tunicatimonas pelagia]
MKYLLTLCLFGSLLVMALPSLAQNDTTSTREITVYLRNGSYVHGRESILRFKGYLTVDTDNFSQKHIPNKKIIYIHYGPPLPQPLIKMWGIEPAFFVSMLAGIQFGDTGSENNRATASILVGYMFHPLLQPSLGLGYMQYEPTTATTPFLRLHGVIPEWKWSPMYFMEVGASRLRTNVYDFNVEYHNTKGGLMLHPGIGIQRRFRTGAVSLQMGYRIQQAELDYSVQEFWGGTLRVQESITYRRLSAVIGFTF